MHPPLLRRPADLEHLCLLAVIAAWVAWFLQSAVRASPSIENLMLIAPAAALSLGLCLMLAITTIVGRHGSNTILPAAMREERKTLTFIALFAAYVGGLAYVAFDLSTFLFVALGLLLLGERNRLLAVGYAAIFAWLTTAALREMLPFPFPSLLV